MIDVIYSPTATASLARRSASIVYDSVAVFGVCFVAAAIAVAWHHGQAIAAQSWGFTVYLVLVSYGYFAYCWRHGRTLGMRSWKLRVVDQSSGRQPSWGQTAIRFCIALLAWLPAGMGYWRAWWDPDGRTWHDRASRTCLIYEDDRTT